MDTSRVRSQVLGAVFVAVLLSIVGIRIWVGFSSQGSGQQDLVANPQSPQPSVYDNGIEPIGSGVVRETAHGAVESDSFLVRATQDGQSIELTSTDIRVTSVPHYGNIDTDDMALLRQAVQETPPGTGADLRTSGEVEIRRSTAPVVVVIDSAGAFGWHVYEPSEQHGTQQLYVEPKHPMVIRVLRSDGTAVSGIQVAARPHSMRVGASIWSGVTDRDGMATWNDINRDARLVGGAFSLFLKSDPVHVTSHVSAPLSEPRQVDIVLPATGVINVSLMSVDGAPFPDARTVWLMPERSSTASNLGRLSVRPVSKQSTMEAGSNTARFVVPIGMSFDIWSLGANSATASAISQIGPLHAGQEVSVSIVQGADDHLFELTLVNEVGGTYPDCPAEGRLTISGLNGTSVHTFNLWTSGDGVLRVVAPAPQSEQAQWAIEVSVPTSRDVVYSGIGAGQVSVFDSSTVATVDIARLSVLVSGTVQDELGEAVVGASVYIEDVDYDKPRAYRRDNATVTAEDGSFEVLGDSRGLDMRILVEKRGRASVRVPFRPGDRALTITTKQGCVLVGRFELRGISSRDLRLEARFIDDDTVPPWNVAVGEDGRFRFRDLPPGEVQLSLVNRRTRKSLWQSSPLTLRAGLTHTPAELNGVLVE